MLGISTYMLYFAIEGGNVRVAGAYGVLCLAIELHEANQFPSEAWEAAGVSASLCSLADISASVEIQGSGTAVDAKAAAVARQNQDSTAEAVHSCQWAKIATTFDKTFRVGQDASGALGKLADLLQSYNSRPDIELSASADVRMANKTTQIDCQ